MNSINLTPLIFSMYWTDWARQAVLRADKTHGFNVVKVKQHLNGVMDLKVLHQTSQSGGNGCSDRRHTACPGLCVGMPMAGER